MVSKTAAASRITSAVRARRAASKLHEKGHISVVLVVGHTSRLCPQEERPSSSAMSDLFTKCGRNLGRRAAHAVATRARYSTTLLAPRSIVAQRGASALALQPHKASHVQLRIVLVVANRNL